ncbi:hypothetical protein BpHYR1_007474 [Brachionus plicatilis]|uniref:Uncharacterized protein n=1 Tax=Brachionus plicatilis TaxID=10195 RepID=A0A3M7Q6F1_BRAPC|nr:hypothetical protein BpHYR1_007474 [Brachionus plicatilis]
MASSFGAMLIPPGKGTGRTKSSLSCRLRTHKTFILSLAPGGTKAGSKTLTKKPLPKSSACIVYVVRTKSSNKILLTSI